MEASSEDEEEDDETGCAFTHNHKAAMVYINGETADAEMGEKVREPCSPAFLDRLVVRLHGAGPV